jgi:thioredoxin-like negative regulator of GroEL
LADLAAEYGGEIYIYKINVDEEPELAYMFGAKSIPMFLFIPMDEVPQMGVGALPKKSFREVIDTFLLKQDQASK